MIRSTLRALRRTGECAAFAAAFPFFASSLKQQGPHARARWGTWLRRGLAPIRETWWDTVRLEPAAAWWRGVWLLESLSRTAATGDGPSAGPFSLPRGARILVVRLGHLGDIVQTAPFAIELKRQRPDVRVDLLTGPWSASLARRYGCFDEVLEYAPDFVQYHRGDRPRDAEAAVLRLLAGRGYTAVLATSPWHLADHLAVAAARSTCVLGASGGLPNVVPPAHDRRRPFDRLQREAVWVCSFLADLGMTPPEHAVLSFPLTAAEQARAASLLSGLAAPCVVLAPGSGWSGKCWPADRFAALGDRLASEGGASIVLLGAPSERELAGQVASLMKTEALNIAGLTSVGESAAVIGRADLLVGNDSAPMHFAAALQTPTLALFGPTSASKWAPAGERHRTLQTELPCTGCCYWHPAATCAYEHRCMKSISVEAAYAEAATLLHARRSQPAA